MSGPGVSVSGPKALCRAPAVRIHALCRAPALFNFRIKTLDISIDINALCVAPRHSLCRARRSPCRAPALSVSGTGATSCSVTKMYSIADMLDCDRMILLLKLCSAVCVGAACHSSSRGQRARSSKPRAVPPMQSSGPGSSTHPARELRAARGCHPSRPSTPTPTSDPRATHQPRAPSSKPRATHPAHGPPARHRLPPIWPLPSHGGPATTAMTARTPWNNDV